MRTVFHDKLVLTLNIKDIRAFQNILQLILHSNLKISELDSKPLEDFRRIQE